MNKKHHQLLHYVLIILLVFSPLRGALAAQLMTCDMGMAVNGADVSLSNHQQHMTGTVQIDKLQINKLQVNSTSNYPEDSKTVSHVKNCCGNKGACISDCHVAIAVSLLTPTVDYSPLLINTDTFHSISSALLVRELSPPSRPPLALYS